MTEQGFTLDRALSAVLAILLAFVVWLATSRDARPIDDVPTFPRDGGIEPTFVNAPEGFVPYARDDPRVTVALRGLRDGIQALGPADLRAVVDLRSLEASDADGEHVLPVRVECAACGGLGIRVGQPVPAEVAVRLDRVIEESRRVSIELPKDAEEERVLVDRFAHPASVTVEGASRQLRRLARVVAVVPLAPDSELGPRAFRSLPLRMLDAQGTDLDGLVAQPERIDAQVTIGERGISLPVVPRFLGGVPDGYFLAGVNYDPRSVRVLGAGVELAPVLDEGQVVTEEIDLADFTTDQVLAVALELPETLRVEGLPEGTITVTLEVRAVPGSRPVDVDVEAIGLRPEISVAVSPSAVRVLVSGPQPALDALEVGDVRAVVNASGLRPGRHRLPVEVRTPASLESLSVTPDMVEIVIEVGGGAGTADQP